MFVRDAKLRCPHLVILSYDFEAYEEVVMIFQFLHLFSFSPCNWVLSYLDIESYKIWFHLQVADRFYDVLHKYCNKVQVWPQNYVLNNFMMFLSLD